MSKNSLDEVLSFQNVIEFFNLQFDVVERLVYLIRSAAHFILTIVRFVSYA